MRRLFPLFSLFLSLAVRAQMNPEWTPPLPPFQIAGNLYYVGSQELAAYLVTTPVTSSSTPTSKPRRRRFARALMRAKRRKRRQNQ